jgi:hypothetical protein
MRYSIRSTSVAFASIGFALCMLSCGGSSRSLGDSSADAAGGRSPADEKSLFLVGVLDTQSTRCVAKPDPSAPLLARGVLDLGLTSQYTASLVIGNQSAPASTSTWAERVALDSAEINLATLDGTLLDSHTASVTSFVDPASSQSAGYGALTVDLILPTLADSEPLKSARDLVANVRIHGSTSNGGALTTNFIAFPIRVCTGCLVQYPARAADSTLTAGSAYLCRSLSSEFTMPSPTVPCLLGQDQPFSCELCADSHPICRDPALNPAY